MEDTYNVWRLRETSGENVNRSEQRREFTRLENGASVHGITSANATRFDASAADKPRGELSFAARKSLRAVILADLIKILENWNSFTALWIYVNAREYLQIVGYLTSLTLLTRRAVK